MYFGAHSITFRDEVSDRHTWRDWHLIPESRPTIPLPNPQHKFVDIPGRHGSLDLTSYLTNELIYSDRSGTLEFIVDNDHEDWLIIYDKIAKYLHGRKLWMILDDDPDWSYYGRFTAAWTSGPNYSRVTITYRVDPFKYGTDSESSDSTYKNIVIPIGENVVRYIAGSGVSILLSAVMTEGPGPVWVTLNNSASSQVQLTTVNETKTVGLINQFGTSPVIIGCNENVGPAKVSLIWTKKSL